MNIIVVATTPFSYNRGSHIRILEEAIALAKAGNSVEILTYPLGNDPTQCKEFKINISRIPNILPWYKKTTAGQSWGKIIFDKILFFKLLFKTFSQKIDILYAHGYESVIAVFLVQKILFWRKIKTIGDFQGSLVLEMILYENIKYSYFKKFLILIEKIIHTMPYSAVASSRPLAEYISKDRKKVCEVFYDAPSIPFIFYNKVEMCKKYNISNDSFVVLYAGGFTKDKGIENLLQLIQNNNLKNIFWVIAGSQKKEIEISEDIKSRILIINYFDSKILQELLSLADCAIDPKKRVSLQASGKMINYMQYGLPVFCFDDVVSRDYLGNEIADLCSGKNIEELVKKIIVIKQNKKLREEIQLKIKNRSKLFSWDKITEKI